MFRKIAHLIMLVKWPLMLALMLITLIMGHAMLKLQIDPSTDSLFMKRTKEYQDYKKFTEQFGSDYVIAVAMATPDLFSASYLEDLQVLTGKIAKFAQVERVISLANAMDIQHKFLGVKVVPVLKEFLEGEESLKHLRKKVLGNELYVKNLISEDGRIANILIYLKPVKGDRESNGAFIKNLKEILAAHERPDVLFYAAGAPIEQYDFIRSIRRDQMIFVPVISTLLVVTTWAVYGNFSCMVLAMVIVFMALVWTMGTIVLMGQELNLVTSLLAPVIMIVSVANVIHLMNLFFEMRAHHKSLREAVRLTMSELGAPSFLSYLATILGFISLAFNPVPAIQNFGIFAAIGTFYAYVIELLVTPILLPILPYRRPPDVPTEHFFNRVIVVFLEKMEFHWKWLIVLLTGLAVFLSIKGIGKLEIDTSLIKQMKPDSPLAVSTRFIDNHLTGVYSLGFVLRRKDGGVMINYDDLRRVDEFKKYLEEQPEIAKVNALTTLVKKIHQARLDNLLGYLIPKDNKRLQMYFEGMVASKDPELWKLITPDFKQLRLEARMRAVGTKEGALMEERVRRYMSEKLSADFDYQLTGDIVLLGKMSKDLVHNQSRGFKVAFGLILILIAIIFRSVKMALLAAVPKLLPILGVYGVMGYAGIELSSPTAMIANIVLGLIVSSSIHFLYRFKLEFKHRQHYLQALHHTFRHVGHSLVVGTFILCMGFAASAFASFRPTIYLGGLTSLTIFFSLVCTLVILPVAVILFKPFGRQRLFRRDRVR